NITLFRRTAAPSLPSLTPQQSHLSKSRGRLAFGPAGLSLAASACSLHCDSGRALIQERGGA
ncbi:hypothetical protein KUCAC02_016025, partial [Chaenocephalus aceratus]